MANHGVASVTLLDNQMAEHKQCQTVLKEWILNTSKSKTLLNRVAIVIIWTVFCVTFIQSERVVIIIVFNDIRIGVCRRQVVLNKTNVAPSIDHHLQSDVISSTINPMGDNRTSGALTKRVCGKEPFNFMLQLTLERLVPAHIHWLQL